MFFSDSRNTSPSTDIRLARQSKLSPTQLEELQRATHFDKKELQQWYKGARHSGKFILDG